MSRQSGRSSPPHSQGSGVPQGALSSQAKAKLAAYIPETKKICDEQVQIALESRDRTVSELFAQLEQLTTDYLCKEQEVQQAHQGIKEELSSAIQTKTCVVNSRIGTLLQGRLDIHLLQQLLGVPPGNHSPPPPKTTLSSTPLTSNDEIARLRTRFDSEKLKNPLKAGEVAAQLGDWFKGNSRHAEAIQYYQSAYGFFMGKSASQFQALLHLIECYLAQKRYDCAESLLSIANEQVPSLPQNVLDLRCDFYIHAGQFLTDTRRYHEALEEISKATQLATQLRDRTRQIRVYDIQIIGYYFLQDFQQAVNVSREALMFVLDWASSSVSERSDALLKHARVCKNSGASEEARQTIQRFFEEAQRPEFASTQHAGSLNDLKNEFQDFLFG